jgi:hypothetical protein
MMKDILNSCRLEILMGTITGQPKSYKPGTWRSFWVDQPIYPSLEDQLDAIRQLGESRSDYALRFLKEEYSPKVKKVIDSSKGFMSGSTDIIPVHIREMQISYYKIGEPLRSKLNYSICLLESPHDPDILKDKDAIKKEIKDKIASSSEHQIIRKVIKSLESKIARAPLSKYL